MNTNLSYEPSQDPFEINFESFKIGDLVRIRDNERREWSLGYVYDYDIRPSFPAFYVKTKHTTFGVYKKDNTLAVVHVTISDPWLKAEIQSILAVKMT